MSHLDALCRDPTAAAREEPETRRQAERIARLLGLDVGEVNYRRASIGGRRLDRDWPIWSALMRLAERADRVNYVPIEDEL